MPKFCLKCGRENGDEAVFCEGCGTQFSSQPAPLTPYPVWNTGPSSSNIVFLAQRVPGEHEHILSDFSFKETDGALSYVVKKTSALHENYDVLDSAGITMGSLAHKTHLTGTDMVIYGSLQKIVCTVKTKGRDLGSTFPNCWLEDGTGNTTASVLYSHPINFDVVKSDGSRMLSAKLALEGGVLKDLRDMGTSRCSVEVFDQVLQGWLAAAVFVSVDCARRTSGHRGVIR